MENAYLVKGYMREQGIIVPKGNPHGIKNVRDIIEKNLRIVNRGRNTGTRILLDKMLREIARELGVSFDDLTSRIRGYHYEVKTHTAVAAAIAQGRADTGIGIRAAAHMYGLDFISLGWERYDFLVQIPRLGKEAVRSFLDKLRSREFAEILSSIPGYAVPRDIGEIIWKPRLSGGVGDF